MERQFRKVLARARPEYTLACFYGKESPMRETYNVIFRTIEVGVFTPRQWRIEMRTSVAIHEDLPTLANHNHGVLALTFRIKPPGRAVG